MKNSLLTLVILACLATQAHSQISKKPADLDQKEIETTESQSEKAQLQTLRFYPNPVIDQLNIVSAKAIDLVQIHSCSGELLLENRNIEYAIDLSHLQKGRYIVTILSGGDVIREKMVRI